MVNRVVATKLTEEEHSKLLEVCNREGCTPSSLIKDAIMKRIDIEEKPVEKEPTSWQKLGQALQREEERKKTSNSELAKFLGMKK